MIGARGAAPLGNFSGSVYVFARGTDGTWSQVQILSASDGAAGNFFGWSVAVNGATALIGARGNGDDPTFPGAAYVFVKGEDGLWTQAQKLTANDGVGSDEFGYSVALLDAAALIGARAQNEKGILAGAAYLFSRDTNGQWTQQRKFTASDGVSGDEFGYSVALLANTALVGARFAMEEEEDPEEVTDVATPRPGAVYVYELRTGENGPAWEEVQKLLASDGTTGDEFGGSLAASGDSLLIGARNENVNGPIVGAVYLFTRTREAETPSLWEERQKILPQDGASGDAFGSSLALAGEVAVIGSSLDDLVVEDSNGDGNTDDTVTFINGGSAYLFSKAAIPAACAVKTDYDDAECSDTFNVASLEDLANYVATDFGRANNDGRYQDLAIVGNLSDSFLVLQSPCEITLDEGIILLGDFVSIDGRKGVSNKRPTIQAEKVCLMSEQGNAAVGDEAIIEVDELTIRAAEVAIIGDNAFVAVDGVLTIEAVGGSESSAAVIDSGVAMSAGSVHLKSPRAAQIREGSRLSVFGALSLVSTLDDSGSEAIVEEGVQIEATDLTISSPRAAEVGKDASIRLYGNFHMAAGSAEQCEIEESAQITAGTRSGNCFSEGP